MYTCIITNVHTLYKSVIRYTIVAVHLCPYGCCPRSVSDGSKHTWRERKVYEVARSIKRVRAPHDNATLLLLLFRSEFPSAGAVIGRLRCLRVIWFTEKLDRFHSCIQLLRTRFFGSFPSRTEIVLGNFGETITCPKYTECGIRIRCFERRFWNTRFSHENPGPADIDSQWRKNI